MSVASELLSLVPMALDLVKLLYAGDYDKAERKAKAIAQGIAIKKSTRAAAAAARKTR